MSQQEQIDHLETLIHEKQRELRRHRERAAAQGFETPPWVLNRIEDLETEIEDLLLELEGLKKLPPEPALPPSQRSSWWLKLAPAGLALVGLVLTVALVSSFASESGGNPGATAASTASPVAVAAVSTPTIEPMPETSFNIAVAQFSDLTDPNDSLLTSGESIALSERLFDTISTTAASLPPSYTPKLRSPADVGPVPGESSAEREENAARLAAEHNATVLIYGSVVKTADGIYLVQPEFDVSKEGFRYGDEILGTHQLGGPVQFRPPLAQPGLVQKINEDLDGRIQALTLIVEGLAEYHYGHAGLAYEKFKLVLAAKKQTDGWQLDDGQEVVHLLMGAAKLFEYGQLIKPNLATTGNHEELQHVLDRAAAHFWQAHELQPDYSRSFLGLGGVALYQATLSDVGQTQLTNIDMVRLLEAKNWYLEAWNSHTDYHPSAFVPAKAAFGIGTTAHLEYRHYIGTGQRIQAEEAKKTAKERFNYVIAAYEETGGADNPSELQLLAGLAYYHLSDVAGVERQYDVVIRHCAKAIEILKSIKTNTPFDVIAECHAWSGFAHTLTSTPNFDAARDHYDQAIKIGRDSGLIFEDELVHWREAQAQLD